MTMRRAPQRPATAQADRSGRPAKPYPAATRSDVLPQLRAAVDGLTPALARLGRYVLAQPERVMYQTVTELAEAADASEASVMRLCRELGFDGFHAFKMAVAFSVNAAAEPPAPTDRPTNTEELVAYITGQAVAALQDTARLLEPAALDRVAAALHKARRIAVFGVANSSAVALNAGIKLMRLGLDAQAYIDPHVAAICASQLGQGDVVIGVSSSGSTIDIVKAVALARRRGAFAVAVANQTRSPLSAEVDEQLIASAPETPLTGGALPSKISQLLIVDALAGLIQLKYPKRLAAVQASAEAISDRSF